MGGTRSGRTVALGVAWILLATGTGAPLAHAEEDLLAFRRKNLPAGWSVQQTVVLTPEQVADIANRLAAPLEGVSNQILSVNGLRVQVNTLAAPSLEDAESALRALTGMRGSLFVAREGRRLFEVLGDNTLVARRVFAALGVGDTEPQRYAVSFRIALIESLDYGHANEVFNLFLRRQRRPNDEAIQARLREITKGWTFGKRLRLLREGHGGARWTFRPEPVRQEDDAAGIATTIEFDDPPAVLGIPYVDVEGTLEVAPRFAPRPGDGSARNRAASARWPSTEAGIAERASKIVAGAKGDRARLLALQRWVNDAIRYDGPVGSRHGVPEVLELGYGRCWDRSDALVTLCRAVGLPARQVAGWVPPLGAGHVWAEVHLEGEGWLPVDATTPWLGVSVDYLPLFGTEDGEMPIVYLARPLVRRLP